MKKQFCLSILALAFIGLGAVHGQESSPSPVPSVLPPPGATMPTTVPRVGSNTPIPTPDDQQDYDGMKYPNEGVSSWLAYPRWAGCCGRVGGCGPIDMEAYVRTGGSVALPFGLFGATMKPGWDVEGGVRSLFFNPAETAAWTAELGITNMNFNTTTKNTQALILNFKQVTPSPIPGGTPTTTIIPAFAVTPSGLNTDTLNIALGREWYLCGSAHDCKSTEWKWRVGFDGGGNWGSERLDLVEIQHKTATIGGFFFSIHTDAEIPCGCALFYAGIRVEYGYLYSNILQNQNNTDLQTASGLLTVGLRY